MQPILDAKKNVTFVPPSPRETPLSLRMDSNYVKKEPLFKDTYLTPEAIAALQSYQKDARWSPVRVLSTFIEGKRQTVVLVGENHSGGNKQVKNMVLDQFESIGYESPRPSRLYELYTKVYTCIETLWLRNAENTNDSGINTSFIFQARARQEQDSSSTFIELETRDSPALVDDIDTCLTILTLILTKIPPFMCICGPCCCLGLSIGLHPTFCFQNVRNHDMAKNINGFLSNNAESKVLLAVMGAAHVVPIAKILAEKFLYQNVICTDSCRDKSMLCSVEKGTGVVH